MMVTFIKLSLILKKVWSILYWECVSCTENQIKYTIYVPIIIIIIIIIISLFAVVIKWQGELGQRSAFDFWEKKDVRSDWIMVKKDAWLCDNQSESQWVGLQTPLHFHVTQIWKWGNVNKHYHMPRSIKIDTKYLCFVTFWEVLTMA